MSRPLTISVTCGFALLALIGVLMPDQKKNESASKNGDHASAGQGVFQTTCATCHGGRGQGSYEKKAPSIASLPRWYIEDQIKNFRSGVRGNHQDDLTGQQMRGAISVLTDEQVSEALDTLETFPAVDHEPTIQGDLKKGAHYYRENCMECHRFNGRGELAFRSSHVAGLQDWYLLAQWQKFKAGVRGYHPADVGGAKMRKAVRYLENDEVAKDVIAYIATLAKKFPDKKSEKPRASDSKVSTK